MTNGALHGLLESLDANSSYLDPAEYKDYKQRKTTARRPSWAHAFQAFRLCGGRVGHSGRAGGQSWTGDSGDIIEAIEGKSTRDMSLARSMASFRANPAR